MVYTDDDHIVSWIAIDRTYRKLDSWVYTWRILLYN